MKTYVLTLLLVIVSLVIPIVIGCKKEVRTSPSTPITRTNIPVFIIDTKKPAGSLRVIVKPLCYDDFNKALMNSKEEGC